MSEVRSVSFGVGWNIHSGPIVEADRYTDRLRDNVTSTTTQMDRLGFQSRDTSNEITRGFQRSQQDIDRTAQSADRTEREIDQLGRSARRASSEGHRGFSLMNSTAAKLTATIAGVFSVAAISRFINSATDSASSLEGYRNTLNVVLKDQNRAASTMAWAVDFANRTPFETDSIVEATVRLQSYGLEARNVLPAIGDMAGVMNKDIMQAVEAVADAQTGELERMKEFGITKAHIAEKAGLMFRNIEVINNKGQIVDQEKFNKALFALMEDRFKGGMEIQAGSFKGIMSTITGVWKTGLAQMAGISNEGEIVVGSFFDILKQKAKSLGDKLTEMANDGTFQRMGVGLSRSLEIAIAGFEMFSDAVGFVRENSEILIPILGGLVIGFTAFKIMTGINALMIAFEGSLMKTALTALFSQGPIAALNLLWAANPFGVAAVAIGILVTAGIALYRNWDTVKAKAIELWEWVGNVWNKFKNNPIGNFLIETNPLLKTIDLITENWEKVSGAISKAWDWLTKWNGKEIKAKQTDFGYVGVRDSVPGFASGVRNFEGGIALVGEEGPELVDLAKGANVTPYRETKDILKNINTNSGLARRSSLSTKVEFKPNMPIYIQGGSNPEETAKATRKELEKMFPDIIEQFFETLARKQGLILES